MHAKMQRYSFDLRYRIAIFGAPGRAPCDRSRKQRCNLPLAFGQLAATAICMLQSVAHCAEEAHCSPSIGCYEWISTARIGAFRAATTMQDLHCKSETAMTWAIVAKQSGDSLSGHKTAHSEKLEHFAIPENVLSKFPGTFPEFSLGTLNRPRKQPQPSRVF